MNTKVIISFILGLVAGGAAGVFGTKKYFEDKYQKKYEMDREDLEEYYHRADEYARYCEADDDTYEGDQNDVNPTDEAPNGGRMTPEERAMIKERLNKNWEGTTNYASIYKMKDKGVNEVGFEGDIDESVEEEDLNAVKNEQDFEEHQKNKNKPPKIISQKAYEELDSSVDHEILYVYADEVVTDENAEIIDEPGLLIGDALTKYDFINSDEEIIFVMNYAQNTCYEINKIDHACYPYDAD